ncbi:hypothetical protein K9L97_05630 [Candidatus Woesearchaeota archaeon]|nr:hypothetical protein [Candidatus Woesearchaeota archaeon]
MNFQKKQITAQIILIISIITLFIGNYYSYTLSTISALVIFFLIIYIIVTNIIRLNKIKKADFKEYKKINTELIKNTKNRMRLLKFRATYTLLIVTIVLIARPLIPKETMMWLLLTISIIIAIFFEVYLKKTKQTT